MDDKYQNVSLGYANRKGPHQPVNLHSQGLHCLHIVIGYNRMYAWRAKAR